MARSFYTHRVKILDKPFYRADGFSTSRTAQVTLLGREDKVIEELYLAIPSIEEIYESIGSNQPLNLDDCYVQGFSLTACRRYLLMDKFSQIELISFSAQNAFLCSGYDVDFSYATILGDSFMLSNATIVGTSFNFSDAVFKTNHAWFNDMFLKVDRVDMNRCQFEGKKVSFKNTAFSPGCKDFQDTDFGNGEVIFTNTDFGHGNVSFVNTRFNDSDVSFKVARFGEGKEDFRYAKFGHGPISFDQTDFGPGRIDFRNVEFGDGKTSFNRCQFSQGEVTFEGAQLKQGKITFLKSSFGALNISFELFEGKQADMTFEKVIFPGSINFSDGIFRKLTFSRCQFNGTLNLNVDTAQEIDLWGCIARDIVDYYSFGESPNVKIFNINGLRLLGKLYMQWETNNVRSMIYSQTSTTVDEKASQFRVLKENFNGLGRYEDEDKAYVEYMRCVQKNILSKDLNSSWIGKIIAYPKYYSKVLVFDWMGLYATSPARVITSILVVQVLFSFLYSLFTILGIGDVVSDLNPEPPLFFKSLYICVITFFTIGYGEFIPLGYSRVLSGLLGFMGVFLMSYFTVAFVRKILR